MKTIMIDTEEYSQFQFERSNSVENDTTQMTIFPNATTTIISTTSQWINTTISVPSNGLSGDAIAGIVIGIILGVIVLVCLTFIIYKYRERFFNLIHKDSKQSNSHSVPDKLNNRRSTNITYSPDHEYLTVNAFTSSRYPPSDEKPTNY